MVPVNRFDKMRIQLTLLFSFILAANVVFAQPFTKKITITNTLMTERSTVQEIEWKLIKTHYPGIQIGNFKLINTYTNEEIPYQLTYNEKTEPLLLLFQLKIGPKQQAHLTIETGKPVMAKQKVFARYIPERKDDFAWENDKIAFRMYGKALESTNENGQGIDVWVKNTNKLVIDERYKRRNYHTDLGDGLDYYQVGATLGAGNLAPFFDNKVLYPGNYTEWEIIDNGPLRTTFRLKYAPFQIGNNKIQIDKTISLDAGSQLNRIEVKFNIQSADEIVPVAIGISKRKEPGAIFFDEKTSILGYWEPEIGTNGITGVGVITLTDKPSMSSNDDQLLLKAEIMPGKSFIYYTGAVWNKANEITTAIEWFNYLTIYAQNLKEPLLINID